MLMFELCPVKAITSWKVRRREQHPPPTRPPTIQTEKHPPILLDAQEVRIAPRRACTPSILALDGIGIEFDGGLC